MTRIYWDTMIFVYWLENHPVYAQRIEQILRSMQLRGDRICTSYLAVGETMAGPLERNDVQGAESVGQFFDSGLVELLQFDRKAAGEFAQLRAKGNVTLADAIHLACASAACVDLFLTNDKGLQKMRVPGIHFIAGLDVNVF